MAILSQHSTIEHTFFAWYGSCDVDPCEPFSLGEHTDILKTIIELDESGSGSQAWSANLPSFLLPFNELRCGHFYFIILKRGFSSLDVPSLTISGRDEIKNYGMITQQCVEPPTPSPTPTLTPTPTPTPTLTPSDCCFDLQNTVSTSGTLDETPDVNGITPFLFEAGGTLCFDSLIITNTPGRYNIGTSDNSIFGYITTKGTLTNNRLVYKSPNSGLCYEVILESESGTNELKPL